MQKQSNPVQIVPPPSGAPKIAPPLGSPSTPGAFGFHGIANAPLRFGGLKRDILEGFKNMAATVDDAALQDDLKDVLHDHLLDAFGAEKENDKSSLVARENVFSEQFSVGDGTGPMAKERAFFSKTTLTEQQLEDLKAGIHDECLLYEKTCGTSGPFGAHHPMASKGKSGKHVTNYLGSEYHE